MLKNSRPIRVFTSAAIVAASAAALLGQSQWQYPTTRKVDHVDTYIGNGYALDSSSTPGGVTIMWVGDGWYRDHFVHGRRVLPS